MCIRDRNRTVHKEFLHGQTVNQHFYPHVLRRLCGKNASRCRRVVTGFCTKILLPPYRPLIQQCLSKNKRTVVPRAPYSPDLAPCDFLFLCMNNELKRKLSCNIEVQRKIMQALDNVPLQEFNKCFPEVGKPLGQVDSSHVESSLKITASLNINYYNFSYNSG